MMPPDMGDAQPRHESTEGDIGSRTQHQMPVIGHQTPAEQIHLEPLDRVGENSEKRRIIRLFAKQGLAIVAAIQHVKADAGRSDAKGARHGQNLTATDPESVYRSCQILPGARIRIDC